MTFPGCTNQYSKTTIIVLSIDDFFFIFAKIWFIEPFKKSYKKV